MLACDRNVGILLAILLLSCFFYKAYFFLFFVKVFGIVFSQDSLYGFRVFSAYLDDGREVHSFFMHFYYSFLFP